MDCRIALATLGVAASVASGGTFTSVFYQPYLGYSPTYSGFAVDDGGEFAIAGDFGNGGQVFYGASSSSTAVDISPTTWNASPAVVSVDDAGVSFGDIPSVEFTVYRYDGVGTNALGSYEIGDLGHSHRSNAAGDIAYVTNSGGLHVNDFATAKATDVASFSTALSQDGKAYYTYNDNVDGPTLAWRDAGAGAGTVSITNASSPPAPKSVFAANANYVLFGDESLNNAPVTLYVVPTTGGEATEIGLVSNDSVAAAITGDGRTVISTYEEIAFLADPTSPPQLLTQNADFQNLGLTLGTSTIPMITEGLGASSHLVYFWANDPNDLSAGLYQWNTLNDDIVSIISPGDEIYIGSGTITVETLGLIPQDAGLTFDGLAEDGTLGVIVLTDTGDTHVLMVPEPGTAMLGVGCLTLVLVRRRRA